MDDEELRQAIKWELDKYIPTSDIAKYYFDFAVLGPAKDVQGIRVLLVAAPLDMIIGITRAVKEAGLKPSAIDIEPLALQRTTNADNAIVIDIGAECCQLNLFQEGSPLVSRFIPFGGARFTAAIVQIVELDFYEAERLKRSQEALLSENIQPGLAALQQNFKQLVGELAREVSRTIDYYQLQNRNAFIDKIILTGGGAKLGHVIDNLSELFAGTQVVIHSPLAMVQISPSLNLERLQEIELQLAVAIGLALRGSDEKYGD
jgi:type IV pilus assembly protein PilM